MSTARFLAALLVADGNASAPGATLTAAASLIPGAATGDGGASAPGATITAAASLIAGSASGSGNSNIRLQPGLELQRGGYAASLTGLRWWVLSEDLTTIENSGTGISTNASGQPTIDINGSASWEVGDYVPLILAHFNAATPAPDRTVLSGLIFVPAVAQA